MLNEERYTLTKEQFKNYANEPSVQHVVAFAKELFGSTESPGIVRMREHAFYGTNLDIVAFIDALQDLTDSK
jgi:hypothetical protein